MISFLIDFLIDIWLIFFNNGNILLNKLEIVFFL